jgi:hypothetical protein
MTTTMCGTSGHRRGYVGEHEPGARPLVCVECAHYVHDQGTGAPATDAAELVERTITELHADLAAEAGGTPWVPVALTTVEAMRTEIDRMINREKTAAQVCAFLPSPVDRLVLADRAEAAFLQANPGIARFYILTTPAKSAKSVKS